MLKVLLYVAFLAAAVSAAPGTGCNANNCLRAVRATGIGTTRTRDCQSYLSVTVTPTPVTLHVTNTVSQTSTSTLGVVRTNTVHETSVTTQRATATTGIPEATVTVTSLLDLRRRQQTSRPSDIPRYASACGGVGEYSSACSCIGVTVATTVLPPLTITVYHDYTASALTTLTTTTATSDKTVVDVTSTVTITDSTKTNVVPASTTTVVTTLSLRQSMAIKLVNVGTGQSLGYLQPGAVNNALYGTVGPLPYKFWFTDDGTLNSATGKFGLSYYSDFHFAAMSETVGAYRNKFYPTLNPDRTLTGWTTNLDNGFVMGLTTWYAPGSDFRVATFVNINVPISAPAGVGWIQVNYVAEQFLG